MVRTIITLSEQDKKWLDNFSQSRRQSTAETIRMAIRHFKGQVQKKSYKECLAMTAGIWKNGKKDANKYVKSLREEWGK